MHRDYYAAVRRKTRILATTVILTNVSGNILLSEGMHEVGVTVSLSPLRYLQAFLNPWVAAGVLLLICWMISQLALLSWADLSYVLPVTASGYILTAILGKFAMGDHVTLGRWAGIGLIAFGVVFVGRTSPRTTPPSRKQRTP